MKKSAAEINSTFCISAAGRRGFSLVEMIVGMLIISILAVLVFEKITTVLSSTRTQLAANELCVNLRYIRNMAMDRERATRVIFTSNSYSVAISDTNGIFLPAANPVTQLPWSNRFSGVELASVSSNTLYFSRTNGVPCNASGVPLTTTGSIAFVSGPIITITPDTGYIDLK